MPQRRVRSRDEQRLLDKAKRYLPGGTLGNTRFADDVAFVVKAGQGSKVFDMSGNAYIDYLLGSGPMILGHAHPAVVTAVRDYLERGSTYFTLNEPVIHLAEVICQAVPCVKIVSVPPAPRPVFALRVAHTLRDKIREVRRVSRQPRLCADEQQPQRSKDFPQAVPDSAEFHAYWKIRCSSRPSMTRDHGAIIERHHHEPAASSSDLPASSRRAGLQGLREVTQRFAIPLIFDEVVTGFRLAWGGAQNIAVWCRTWPPLARSSVGLPLSAVVGHADLMEPLIPIAGVGRFYRPNRHLNRTLWRLYG
jgi:glutamate-1-semialdehyde 2,1-aminomutase